MIRARFSMLALAVLLGACASVQTSLQTSAAAGDDAAVMALLSEGVDPNQYLPDGSTPLITAVFHERATTVRLLLAQHADPNKTNLHGAPPLAYAARLEDPQIAVALLEAGAKPDVRFSNDQTPLFLALSMHRVAVVEALLSHHADPNAATSSQTPIEYATYTNQPAVVAALVAHGVKPIGVKGRVGLGVNPLADGSAVVAAALPGSPAADAGIAAGDRIVAIDGQPVAGWKLADIIGKLRGDAGEAVSVTVARGAEPERTYRLVRQAVGTGSDSGPAAPAAGAWWQTP